MPKAASRRSGFILAYVLFALALLSIVIAGASRMAGNNATQKQIDADVERIVAGARLIRMQLLLCAAIYPLGANVTLAGGTGTVRTSYPVVSASGTLQTGKGDAAGLVCPGAPAGSQGLWSGSLGGSGVSYLAPPAAFPSWQYQLASDGKTADLTLNQSNATTGAAALRRAKLQLGPDATYDASNGTLKLALARP